MLDKKMALALIGASLAALTACSSSRDVSVSGEVSAPSTLAVQSDVFVEFFDLTGEGDELERTSVHSIRQSIGSFDETISIEGEKIVVRAINDTDGDGACSAGEAWAEAEATVADDDTVSGIQSSSPPSRARASESGP